MRELTFSVFSSATDNNARPETHSWDDWRVLLTNHDVRGSREDATSKSRLDVAKNGPAIVLGRLDLGAPHTNESVRDVQAIGLDIEDCTDAQILAALEHLFPFEFVVATTHKHAAEGANKDPAKRSRVRVVLPLAEPIAPEQHKALWIALNRLIGGIADKKTKNVGRLFYLPSTYDPDVAWSSHNSGAWLSPDDLAAPAENDRPAPKLDHAEEVRKIRAALKRMPVEETNENGRDLKVLARKVLAGESFAEAGDRHNAALDLTMWLALKLDPAPSTAAVVEVFANSLHANAQQDNSAPAEADLAAAWEGAVAKAVTWREQNASDADRKAIELQLKKAAPGEGPYSDEDLDRIATAANVPHDANNLARALQRRWILQAGENDYYILQPDGGYRGPLGMRGARLAATRLLARAPVLLNAVTQRTVRRRPIDELAEDYGSEVKEVIVDLTRDRTSYEYESGRLYEAARPIRRALVPIFDPTFDLWLRVFAGSHYEKLCDWLACVPDLSKDLCAVYFSGPASTGKSFLSTAISRLWSDSPAEIGKVLSSFNDEIIRCPLILADEGINTGFFGRDNVLEDLRRLISSQDRTLTRKYRAPAALKGCIRLMIAANNDFLLRSKESLSSEDLDAVALRFMHLTIPEESRDQLQAIPYQIRNGWMESGIAAHVLWLADNRKVERGKRFWVEGNIEHIHRALVSSSRWTALVCEWLVRYLINPRQFAHAKGLIRVGKGQVLVNEQALLDGWKIYFPDTKQEPETQSVGSALRALSETGRKQLRWEGRHIRYRVVKPELLLSWSETNGVGDRDQLRASIWTSATEEEKAAPDFGPIITDKTTDELEPIGADAPF